VTQLPGMQTSFTLPICEDRPASGLSESVEDVGIDHAARLCLEDDYQQAVATARSFHELLIENSDLLASERKKVAREIAGLLFLAQSRCKISAHMRQFLSILHGDAEQRAGLSQNPAFRSSFEILDYYDRLASVAYYSDGPVER
jgi:hypothetical protein